MAYVNRTGKCRRQLHVMDEVGRTKAGACKGCARLRETDRWKLRDYTTRIQVKPKKVEPVVKEWTPSRKPYVPGHAVSVSVRLKAGKCGCGERWTGTEQRIRQLHLEHVKSILDRQSG